jgi:hypothetical protein
MHFTFAIRCAIASQLTLNSARMRTLSHAIESQLAFNMACMNDDLRSNRNLPKSIAISDLMLVLPSCAPLFAHTFFKWVAATSEPMLDEQMEAVSVRSRKMIGTDTIIFRDLATLTTKHEQGWN